MDNVKRNVVMKLYTNISLIFLIWSVSVFLVAYLGFSSFPSSAKVPSFKGSLAIFDGGHYLTVAEYGYREKNQYAFFPLYPMLINLLEKITGSYLSAGLMISFVSQFLALNLFYQLISLEFGKKYALNSLWALLLFPTSFYSLIVYTESLFFLLCIATFLAMKKGNFYLATITCVLASATKLVGLPLVASFLVFVHAAEGFNKKNWYVFLAPLGFLLYSAYLYNTIGDPFYFVKAQTFWHGSFAFPGSSVFFVFKQLFNPEFIAGSFRDVLDFILVIFAAVMVWRVFVKLGVEYTIFSVGSLLLPLFSPTIAPMPRYILTIFPIFIVAGLLKDSIFIQFYRILSPMLLAVFVLLFINGIWGV